MLAEPWVYEKRIDVDPIVSCRYCHDAANDTSIVDCFESPTVVDDGPPVVERIRAEPHAEALGFQLEEFFRVRNVGPSDSDSRLGVHSSRCF